MAYSLANTPRFYCNVIEWLDAIGMTRYDGLSRYGISTSPYSVNQLPMSLWYTLSASTITTIPVAYDEISKYIAFPIQEVSYSRAIGENGFIAYLGHNFRSINFPNPSSFKIWSRCANIAGVPIGDPTTNTEGVVNWGSTHYVPIEYDGFSISLGIYSAVTGLPGGGPSSGAILYQTDAPADTPIQLNSIVVGSYYDMPHSADLKLTMTREMDGVKKTRTAGGNDLMDYRYTGSPPWGDNVGAWELNEFNVSAEEWKLSRKGRRTWSLSFKYLKDSDIFPKMSNLMNYGLEGWDSSQDVEIDTLLLDDTFYGQVLNKTLGGRLAFIFQPNVADKTNFAICKFDMNSFQFNQVGNGIYNCKLKIREVW